ncbi:hypothetical protein, partial [Jatrophihabitans endophyticus]|uniref:hypothetical protein n=1 Tax=Jatrophihabitans endophyticus TaxID=1206085 RepID=UPI0019F58414
MLVFRLALRAVRWRAGAAASVFAVALVAVLAATVGPIYLHAVNERVLATHLRDAGRARSDVVVSRTSDTGYSSVRWARQVAHTSGRIAASPFFGPPATTASLPIGYGQGLPPASGVLATVAGQCAHVHLVAGRCVSATSTRDTMLSTKTAARIHRHVGDDLRVTAQTTGATIRLRIVGLYRPVDPGGAYWSPWQYFRAGEVPRDDAPPPTDAAFVSQAGIRAQLNTAAVTFEANVPFLPANVRYADIGSIRTTLAQADDEVLQLGAAASSSGTPVVSVTTDLNAVLRSTQRETSLARTLVTVATVQLALLAILVLYAVVSNTAGAAGPEVALAKLRGRPTRSVLLQSIAQPLVLVVLAAPVAALLAFVLVRLLAPHLIGRGADVSFPPSAYGVAAVAAAGGVLAAVVAARRTVVTPVGALLRRGAEAPASRTGLLVADAAALTIAVAGLVELKVGGVLDGSSPNPLAVLAPTLLAIAVAVLVLRLMPFVGRRVAGWTRDSRRLATFLAVRQLLRRPAEARALLLVAVALAIAAFAVTNWTDARDNRAARALNATGADTVLVVRPPSGVVDLRPDVDRADPSGQSMAVEYSEADGLPPLLAVDPARFAAVSAWTRANTPQSLAAV